MKKARVCIFVCICISCDDKIKVTVDFDYLKCAGERAQLDSSKPQHYQYNLFGSGGEFHTDTLVIVENGQFKKQEPVTEYGAASEQYQTIDNIYETIENVYKEYNNTEQEKYWYLTKIKIEYDETNHIPVRIDYYYYVTEGLADAGDHYIYEIKNYQRR